LAAGPFSPSSELCVHKNHSEEEAISAGLTTTNEVIRLLDCTALIIRVEYVLEVVHVGSVFLWRKCAEG